VHSRAGWHVLHHPQERVGDHHLVQRNRPEPIDDLPELHVRQRAQDDLFVKLPPQGYRLKRPCKHCPFAPTDTRIKFACAERAEEIAESAYRNGFPCHQSADLVEDDDGDSDGYVFGEKTQHCVGALMMFLSDSHGCWPGIENDDDLAEQINAYVDWAAPHYESEEDFVKANT
jgi:hypothetical protein